VIARWGTALRLTGLALLLWLLTRADWGVFARHIGQVDTAYLYAMPLFTSAMIAVRALRWNRILSVRGISFPHGRAWSIYATGVFLGTFTPGRLGDLAKAGYARQERGMDWRSAVASAVLDRLFDMVFMAGVGIAAAVHFGWPALGERDLLSERTAPMLAGLVFAFCAVGWAVRRWLIRHTDKTGMVGRWGDLLREGGREMAELTQVVGWQALVLTVLAYAIYFAQTICMAKALELPLTAWEVVAAIALVGLASFLPISIAGLGTREGGLTLIMAHCGVPDSAEAALAYSALFFAFCFLLPGGMGFVCFWSRPLALQGLREATSEILTKEKTEHG
jgi:uncharacterized membrane protein YbhN (UPF0104 family)